MLQKHTDREETLTRIPWQKHKNINTRTYKYKIVKGISNIKGGIQVLRKLNYPKEIMNSLIK